MDVRPGCLNPFPRMATSSRPPWFCAQIGAREHYAVPRALHQTGQLAALYTDFWAGAMTRSLLPRSGAFAALAARFHPDLAGATVRSCNLHALAWEARLRLSSKKEGGRYLGYCEVGRRFACAVREQASRRDFAPGAIFFAYDTGALEAFAALRPRGVRCVLDQIDPNRVEVELVREEEKRWPGWAARATEVPEAYFQRREQEWTLADRIVVNSEFSRQALIRQGVPADKLAVIPLCYEPDPLRDDDRREAASPGPLRVLFLGQVILRKGIQYLMEAAKLLRDEPVHFDVVGPIGIRDEAVHSAPPNLTFHGRAGRDQIGRWYGKSHLFVLPTLSDGFALTQLEAMAHGLPVIVTPNCGDVVTDGADGRIVPPRDAEALARAITGYVADREKLRAHQARARQKAGQFTLSRLGENLAALSSS
jgi:glycosyltransferase involved in cell wall biosynthesis